MTFPPPRLAVSARSKFATFAAACSLAALALPAPSARAADWPQWRGASRDDLSKESGLLKKWPEAGPEKIWSYTQAGKGYSGFAISKGRLFTMGTRDQNEVLLCVDAEKGTEIWSAKLGSILENKWGDGPRGTPTVDGDQVFALGGDGTLCAFQASTGQELWRVTMQSLGGKTPGWGYTESVLVDGDLVVCTPGGPNGTVAALQKATGKTAWQSKELTFGAHYSSVVPAVIHGEAQYVQRTMESVFGISPKDGRVLWKQTFPGKVAVIPTPIVSGNQVYVTAGYGVGCLSFTVEKDHSLTMVYDQTTSTEKVMKNHHGGVILLDGYLYGYSDGLGWVCQDFKTGKLVWQERQKLGKGAVAYADGHLYCLDESNGNLALVEASPKGWNEISRFKISPQTSLRSPDGRIWTHPVISNGRLYLRDQELIHCHALK